MLVPIPIFVINVLPIVHYVLLHQFVLHVLLDLLWSMEPVLLLARLDTICLLMVPSPAVLPAVHSVSPAHQPPTVLLVLNLIL